MDKLAGLTSLAEQMPTNMKMPTTIGSITNNKIPGMPRIEGVKVFPNFHNPFPSPPAQAIPLAPEASAPRANSPNARPAPEIVTVIEAANSAVKGSANKVAALLENPQVVKAAQNLVNKITPAKANPSPSAKNANVKNTNAKNANVKNSTAKNANSKKSTAKNAKKTNDSDEEPTANPPGNNPTANDSPLAGNNKNGKTRGTKVRRGNTRKSKKSNMGLNTRKSRR